MCQDTGIKIQFYSFTVLSFNDRIFEDIKLEECPLQLAMWVVSLGDSQSISQWYTQPVIVLIPVTHTNITEWIERATMYDEHYIGDRRNH